MSTWVRVIGLPPTQSVSGLVTVTPDGTVTTRAVGHSPDWPVVDRTRSTSAPYREPSGVAWAR